MSKRISLVPCYGRDYKSKAEIVADLLAGKDFTIADCSNPFHGRPVNLPQLLESRYTTANVRYKALRQVAVLELGKLKSAPATPTKATAKRVTREQIQTFRSEALAAGNTELVQLCGKALMPSGIPAQRTAMAKVSKIIRESNKPLDLGTETPHPLEGVRCGVLTVDANGVWRE